MTQTSVLFGYFNGEAYVEREVATMRQVKHFMKKNAIDQIIILNDSKPRVIKTK